MLMLVHVHYFLLVRTDKQSITSRSRFRKHMEMIMSDTVAKRKLEQTSLLSYVKDSDKTRTGWW